MSSGDLCPGGWTDNGGRKTGFVLGVCVRERRPLGRREEVERRREGEAHVL